jgi:hypothetical protein
VYDDPELGVFALSKHRGHPKLLKVDPNIQSDIKDLRKSLTFDSKTKLVLLLSFSTDNMIKRTMMYPEVYFMDCTGRANQQKRELFISVVRSPSGNCYMSTVTVIPSGDDPIFLTYLLAIANVLTVIVSSCPVREGMSVPIYYSVHFSKAIW